LEDAVNQSRVLIVEDHDDVAMLIEAWLERSAPGEFQLTRVDRLAAALDRLSDSPPDCVLLDLSLKDANGLEAPTAIHALAPEVPVVILSGLEDEALAVAAVQQGAQDYLVKGQANQHSVRRAVRYAIERKRGETELTRQARSDHLTGLPNRAHFLECVTNALARGKRYGERIAVLFMDLDGFKPINDRFGHAAGDELLVRVAARLRDVVRKSDTPARFGGDEFTILCEQIADEPDAVATAKRVIDGMRTGFDVSGKRVTVGVSIGIALSTAGYDNSAESLVRQADNAMYEAKHGRRGYHVFTHGPRISLVRASGG
jgi:diguanylate cyclase (GGDEF)-like protein